MADLVKPSKKVKALAITSGRTNLTLTFIPIRLLTIFKKQDGKQQESVEIGELLSNSGLKDHLCAIHINEWVFCIEVLTEDGKKATCDTVPDNQGVVAGYYKGEFYYSFGTIRVDKDPRKDFIRWFTEKIYPLFN